MCSACTASAEFSLLRSAKAQIIHQLHLPMEGWAWGLLIQALTCQALLSFALSLRLYWGERTLELAKGCLKLCVVFHKQLNDEPSNPIEKTFPQMQWGVAGRVWNFQGLKRHLYSSCVKKDMLQLEPPGPLRLGEHWGDLEWRAYRKQEHLFCHCTVWLVAKSRYFF